MDFSPEIMRDFGLNLAGYFLVALLVHLVFGWTRKKPADADNEREMVSLANKTVRSEIEPARASTSRLQFVTFDESTQRPESPVRQGVKEVATETVASSLISRQENRRAIYREARRLLARGKSNHELLHHLPLTENEIAMLSVSRQT